MASSANPAKTLEIRDLFSVANLLPRSSEISFPDSRVNCTTQSKFQSLNQSSMAETIPIRIILMKAFGSLSAVLALLVIYIIFRSTGGSSAVSSSRTYHRVMFGMSIANILVSISIASTNSTIPVHDETYIENLACDAHAIPMYFGML